MASHTMQLRSLTTFTSAAERLGRLSSLWASFPGSAKAQVIAGLALVVIMVVLIALAASHLRSPGSQVELGAAFGVAGTGASLLAMGLAERSRYVESTAVLALDEREGISPQPLDCSIASRSYRITAMIVNRGTALARRVRATLTLELLKCNTGGREDRDAVGSHRETELGPRTNDGCKGCSFDCCERGSEILEVNRLRSYFEDNCLCPKAQRPLVNSVVSLRVKEELLSWAVPENQVMAPGRPAYGYETSIAPGQVARLHLFDLFELRGPSGKDDGDGGPKPSELEINFHSEYEHTWGPIYRACVRLDEDVAIRATVRVFGEGVRRPLVITMCLRPECLRRLLERLRECLGGANCTTDDIARASLECLNASSRLES